jgi:PBP1b-binding outer membrane lipoprotein LpoB
MRTIALLLPFVILLTAGCQRKLSTKEVKNNLEKTMATYLRNQQRPDLPPLRFEMIDVSYLVDDSNYQCRFTIKLYRPDGSDTTGIIVGKVSRDFSTVSAK